MARTDIGSTTLAPSLDSIRPEHEFLVIARVGANSLHTHWMRPELGRNFDILLSAYDTSVERPEDNGVFLELRPGPKVAAIGKILSDYERLVAMYKYIAIIDDDIDTNALDLARIFEIAKANLFKICQPSLTWDSYFTFAGLIQNKRFQFRYVNYIEMMCPVFEVGTLMSVRRLFQMGYESGIDLVWCNVGDPSPRDFAVIDAVAVRHTRPVGSAKAANGFTPGRRYEDDIYRVLEHFRLPWLSCVPYAGVRSNGAVVVGRAAHFLSALKLIGAIPKRPGAWSRARHVAVHLMHILCRPPRNIGGVDLGRQRGAAEGGPALGMS